MKRLRCVLSQIFLKVTLSSAAREITVVTLEQIMPHQLDTESDGENTLYDALQKWGGARPPGAPETRGL